jgi:hypothetical protein
MSKITKLRAITCFDKSEFSDAIKQLSLEIKETKNPVTIFQDDINYLDDLERFEQDGFHFFFM